MTDAPHPLPSMRRYWADDKTLSEVLLAEPVLYNLKGQPLIHVFKADDVRAVFGPLLNGFADLVPVLDCDHDVNMCFCENRTLVTEAQRLLTILEGR